MFGVSSVGTSSSLQVGKGRLVTGICDAFVGVPNAFTLAWVLAWVLCFKLPPLTCKSCRESLLTDTGCTPCVGDCPSTNTVEGGWCWVGTVLARYPIGKRGSLRNGSTLRTTCASLFLTAKVPEVAVCNPRRAGPTQGACWNS